MSKLLGDVRRMTASPIKYLRMPRRLRKEFRRFNEQALRSATAMPAARADLFPIVGDATASVEFDPHYIYHTAWAARILAQTRPAFHVDFSSSLYFACIVSAFCDIRHYDFRVPAVELDNLSTGQADLSSLEFADNSLPSVSCMHVVEHIGLGRYGDPIDADGDRKAARELSRVVKLGGQLLYVVPVGRPRVMFNAHRVYAFEQVIDAFPNMRLNEFALITLRGKPRLIRNADPAAVSDETYGCGCFWFIKAAQVGRAEAPVTREP